MHNFTEILTSMLHHLRPPEKEYSFIENIPHEKLGQPMGNMDGTLDHHCNNIIVSNVMYHLSMPFRDVDTVKTIPT